MWYGAVCVCVCVSLLCLLPSEHCAINSPGSLIILSGHGFAQAIPPSDLVTKLLGTSGNPLEIQELPVSF